MIGAEGLAASVAMELIAGRAEELAAGVVGAGMDGQNGIAAVFVVFNGETVEIGLAFGAGSGSEAWSAHATIMLDPLKDVKRKLPNILEGDKLSMDGEKATNTRGGT